MDKVASILFGKARQAVLATLYGQPDRGFFMRELSRVTGIATGPLQHELSQLVSADLILREPDGNRTNYRANKNSPVFPELRALVEKTCGAPKVIGDALAELGDRISHAAIYGSIAKGSEHARSDVDLLIIGAIPFAELIAAIPGAEAHLGREINPRLFSEDDLRERINAGDRFVCGVLTGPLLIIKGDWDGFRDAARTRSTIGTDRPGRDRALPDKN